MAGFRKSSQTWFRKEALLCILLTITSCDIARQVASPAVPVDPKRKSADSQLTQPSLTESTLVATSDNVNPGESITVTLTVNDGNKTQLTGGGLNIGFRTAATTTVGASTGTFSDVTDNLDGTYTSVFTGVGSGSATNIEAYIEDFGVFSSQPSVTVNFTSAPSGLTYPQSVAVYPKGTAISPLTPTASGVVVSYVVLPPLPDGLALDPATGVISGTPVTASSAANYVITATNPLGSASFTLNLTVLPSAPDSLSYDLLPAYIRGASVGSHAPTVNGTVSSYSVSPALPTGLSLNASTGVISGTVSTTATMGPGTYVVTATNAGGSTTVSLPLTINPRAPTGLTYTTSTVVYPRNVAIASNSATVSGGDAPYVFTVSPSLPTGLALNSSTGQITGTPTTTTAAATYTVTATNSSGSQSATLNITVQTVAPSALTYTTLSPVYERTIVISTNTPTYSGNTATNFAASPALPSGLSLDPVTGLITGTPTVTVDPAQTYAIVASNETGSSLVNLNIRVKPLSVSNLNYGANTFSYSVGSTITPVTPTYSGDAPTSYSVSPALPSGLFLNATTGVLSGTPAAAAALAVYTITASHSGNSTTRAVTITVPPRAPTSLSYTVNPATYVRNTAITANSLTVSGGDGPYTYTISPSLPVGLSFNSTNGQITGTPTVATASAVYVVTAANSTGSKSVNLTISVPAIAPSALTYTTSAPVYDRTVTIASNSPSSAGDAPTSYSVSPALPTGLSLNTVTGVITGTPTITVDPASTYTVTASNSAGSTSTNLSIRVRPLSLTALNYGSNTLRNVVGTAMTPITPTYTGDAPTSYSVSPPLPSGLSLNTTTGVLSGTPTVSALDTIYTFTASHSGNSITRAVTIENWASTRATEFNSASSQYATTAAASSLLSTSITQFSIQAWVKARATPTANDGLLGATTGANGFGMFWQTSSVLRFFVNGTGNYAASSSLTPTNWNHIVGTYTTTSTGNIKIYVNGVLSNQSNLTVTLSNLSDVFAIGRRGAAGSYGNVIVSEVGLWNVALSSAAVSSLYNGGHAFNLRNSVGSYTQAGNLRAYWRAGELDTAPTLKDRAGVVNLDATLLNSAAIIVDAP